MSGRLLRCAVLALAAAAHGQDTCSNTPDVAVGPGSTIQCGASVASDAHIGANTTIEAGGRVLGGQWVDSSSLQANSSSGSAVLAVERWVLAANTSVGQDQFPPDWALQAPATLLLPNSTNATAPLASGATLCPTLLGQHWLLEGAAQPPAATDGPVWQWAAVGEGAQAPRALVWHSGDPLGLRIGGLLVQSALGPGSTLACDVTPPACAATAELVAGRLQGAAVLGANRTAASLLDTTTDSGVHVACSPAATQPAGACGLQPGAALASSVAVWGQRTVVVSAVGCTIGTDSVLGDLLLVTVENTYSSNLSDTANASSSTVDNSSTPLDPPVGPLLTANVTASSFVALDNVAMGAGNRLAGGHVALAINASTDGPHELQVLTTLATTNSTLGSHNTLAHAGAGHVVLVGCVVDTCNVLAGNLTAILAELGASNTVGGGALVYSSLGSNNTLGAGLLLVNSTLGSANHLHPHVAGLSDPLQLLLGGLAPVTWNTSMAHGANLTALRSGQPMGRRLVLNRSEEVEVPANDTDGSADALGLALAWAQQDARSPTALAALRFVAWRLADGPDSGSSTVANSTVGSNNTFGGPLAPSTLAALPECQAQDPPSAESTTSATATEPATSPVAPAYRAMDQHRASRQANTSNSTAAAEGHVRLALVNSSVGDGNRMRCATWASGSGLAVHSVLAASDSSINASNVLACPDTVLHAPVPGTVCPPGRYPSAAAASLLRAGLGQTPAQVAVVAVLLLEASTVGSNNTFGCPPEPAASADDRCPISGMASNGSEASHVLVTWQGLVRSTVGNANSMGCARGLLPAVVASPGLFPSLSVGAGANGSTVVARVAANLSIADSVLGDTNVLGASGSMVRVRMAGANRLGSGFVLGTPLPAGCTVPLQIQTALADPAVASAQSDGWVVIGEGNVFGDNVWIEPGVVIGDNNKFAAGTRVRKGTVIGSRRTVNQPCLVAAVVLPPKTTTARTTTTAPTPVPAPRSSAPPPPPPTPAPVPMPVAPLVVAPPPLPPTFTATVAYLWSAWTLGACDCEAGGVRTDTRTCGGGRPGLDCVGSDTQRFSCASTCWSGWSLDATGCQVGCSVPAARVWRRSCDDCLPTYQERRESCPAPLSCQANVAIEFQGSCLDAARREEFVQQQASSLGLDLATVKAQSISCSPGARRRRRDTVDPGTVRLQFVFTAEALQAMQATIKNPGSSLAGFYRNVSATLVGHEEQDPSTRAPYEALARFNRPGASNGQTETVILRISFPKGLASAGSWDSFNFGLWAESFAERVGLRSDEYTRISAWNRTASRDIVVTLAMTPAAAEGLGQVMGQGTPIRGIKPGEITLMDASSATYDLNECELGVATCSSQATCGNTVGSFFCVCNKGYTGSGVSCAPDGSPIDGGWSAWQGECQFVSSARCGAGTWLLRRSCTNPQPTNGGQPCAGPATMVPPASTCFEPCRQCALPRYTYLPELGRCYGLGQGTAGYPLAVQYCHFALPAAPGKARLLTLASDGEYRAVWALLRAMLPQESAPFWLGLSYQGPSGPLEGAATMCSNMGESQCVAHMRSLWLNGGVWSNSKPLGTTGYAPWEDGYPRNGFPMGTRPHPTAFFLFSPAATSPAPWRDSRISDATGALDLRRVLCEMDAN